jgi:hypothetical protein
MWPSDVTAATRQIIAAKTPMPNRYYFPQSNDYRLTILDGRFLLGCRYGVTGASQVC